jgi:hypothetical protein
MTSPENGFAILRDWKGKSLGMVVVRPDSPKDNSWDAARITDVSSQKLTIFCRGEGEEETVGFDVRGGGISLCRCLWCAPLGDSPRKRNSVATCQSQFVALLPLLYQPGRVQACLG